MTEKRFDDVPGWTFRIDEVSVGIYEVLGRSERGDLIFEKGPDYEAMMESSKSRARALFPKHPLPADSN